jgi:hypothetical protein
MMRSAHHTRTGGLMIKIGLIFQLVSFLMFFWDAEIRTLRPMEKGGGFCTSPFEKKMQLQQALFWIPCKIGRESLSDYFHWISAGLFIIGTIFQLG